MEFKKISDESYQLTNLTNNQQKILFEAVMLLRKTVMCDMRKAQRGKVTEYGDCDGNDLEDMTSLIDCLVIPSESNHTGTLFDKLRKINPQGKSVLQLCNEINGCLSPIDRIRTSSGELNGNGGSSI